MNTLARDAQRAGDVDTINVNGVQVRFRWIPPGFALFAIQQAGWMSRRLRFTEFGR